MQGMFERCNLHCPNMLFVVSLLSVVCVLLKSFAVSLRNSSLFLDGLGWVHECSNVSDK